MSNQRMSLSSDAVMRMLAFPPHRTDRMGPVWTPTPISKPGAVDATAFPFVLRKVGEFGEDVSLCGELEDWDRS